MIATRIAKSLGLTPDQFVRASPFFVVYLLLFTALTIADAVSVSLFASRIGADRLPAWYSATAVLSLVMMAWYLTRATRVAAEAIFRQILVAVAVLFLVAWATFHYRGGAVPLGMLFVTREVAVTLILMHFGTFLQDFFVRAELNRILPIIYAGGRVGGIVGGGLVGSLATRLGTVNLVPLVVALIAVAAIGIVVIARRIERRDEEPDPPQVTPSPSPLPVSPSPPTEMATTATAGDAGFPAWRPASKRWIVAVSQFLIQVRTVPLLGWLTATTLFFVGCRWFLAYQYTSFFEHHFADDVAMASFLGRYTQIALLISLGLQLFVVNRLVDRFGVATTHFAYSLLVLAGLGGNWLLPGLPLAIAGRFLESELRFGLRNPVNQMLVNRFPKRMRIVVRGWSLGWLIPIGTLTASAMLGILLAIGAGPAVAIVGCLLGIGFVVSAYRVGRAYNQYEPH